MRARSLVRMAIEWCGIIAFIHETSATVSWLRTSHNARANTAALAATIPTFAARLAYMFRMNASMMIAMLAPITSAM
jgi:hypothetical protein